MSQEPALWNLQLNINSSIRSDLKIFGIGMDGTSVTNLYIDCDIDWKKQGKKKDISAEVDTKEDAWLGPLKAGNASACDAAPPEFKYLNISRNIVTKLPEMDFTDNDTADQPANSMSVDLEATVTGNTECHLSVPFLSQMIPSQSFTMRMPVKFNFPYNPFSLTDCEGDTDLTPYFEDILKAVPFPDLTSDLKGTVHYKLKKKDLNLGYFADVSDFTRNGGSYHDMTAVTPHVCYNPNPKSIEEEGWLVHGNYLIQVSIDKSDQVKIENGHGVSQFGIYRLTRSSQFDEKTNTYIPNKNTSKNMSSGKMYTDGTGVDRSKDLSHGWVIDWNGDGTADWTDVPGDSVLKRPSIWPKKKFQFEAIIGVQNFPEFGFIYISIIFETCPGTEFDHLPNKEISTDSGFYRISYRKAAVIELETVREILSSDKPYIELESYPFDYSSNGGVSGWIEVHDDVNGCYDSKQKKATNTRTEPGEKMTTK